MDAPLGTHGPGAGLQGAWLVGLGLLRGPAPSESALRGVGSAWEVLRFHSSRALPSSFLWL